MDKKEFDEYWNNLTQKQQKEIKELVIERIKKIPNNLKLCIG
jgi:hypothetical protein